MKAAESRLQKLVEGTNQYLVPLFQRPYAWGRKQWEQLWDDIVDLGETSEGEHFIGPIVTSPAESVLGGVAKYLLIDGQQRLTTLLILLAAMRDRAGKIKLPLLHKEIDEKLLQNVYNDGDDRFKLLPTQGDRESFIAIIRSDGERMRDGIWNCYRFFAGQLGKLSGEELAKHKTLVTHRLMLVWVELDKTDNPHVVFESLNSKSLDLTQADLIRNYFLMKVPVDQQQRVFDRHWKPLQERLGDDATEFIRHFLMMGGSYVQIKNVYWTLKKEVDGKRGTEEVEEYLARLERFSVYYRKITNPGSESNPELRARFSSLKRMDITTAHTLMLAMYDDFANGGLTHEDFLKALDLLENYVVRRSVCQISLPKLASLFPGIFGKAKQEGNFVEGLAGLLERQNYPTDAEFLDRLRNASLYVEKTSTRAKLILERIEASLRNGADVPFETLEVGHVMPKDLTPAWRNMLGAENADEDHETWLNTLGNLTLMPPDDKYAAADFSVRKRMLIDSGLELNRCYAGVEVWNRAAIEQRGNELAQRALAVWPNFASGDWGHLYSSDGSDITHTRPRMLRIAGKEIGVDTWKGVLRETIYRLIELEPDLPARLQAAFPRWCGPREKDYIGPVEISSGLYFEGHASGRDLVRRCKRIMETAGWSEGELEWSVETAQGRNVGLRVLAADDAAASAIPPPALPG